MNIQLQYNLFTFPYLTFGRPFFFYRTFKLVVLRRTIILRKSNCHSIQCITKSCPSIYTGHQKLITLNISYYTKSSDIFYCILPVGYFSIN